MESRLFNSLKRGMRPQKQPNHKKIDSYPKIDIQPLGNSSEWFYTFLAAARSLCWKTWGGGDHSGLKVILRWRLRREGNIFGL